MAIHKNFSSNPFEILNPEERWFPADEILREKGYQKLLPPLVDKIRREVKKFRDLLSLTKNFADKNNSNLIFVYLPYSLRYDEIVKQEKYYETFDKKDYFKIKEILKDLDIKFIDTHTEVFSKRDNPLEFFPFKKPNTHYTSEAYKLIGELIYNRTKQN